MPISFSAWRSISLVTLWGVGDGNGEGKGDAAGVGACARAVAGFFIDTSPAMPAPEKTFNNRRRSKLADSLESFPNFCLNRLRSIVFPFLPSQRTAQGTIVPVPPPGELALPYLSLRTFARPDL
jgi:hypothetical protein